MLKNYHRLFLFLISFFFSNPKTTLSILINTIKSLKSVFKYSKLGYPILTSCLLDDSKKSNTLFILGSGPSINKLTDLDWKYIKSKDSWGFNFWFCHNHVPNCYFAQSAISNLKDHTHINQMDDLMAKMLYDKKEEYKDVNFYLRGDGVNSFKFHKTKLGRFILSNHLNFHFLPEFIVSSKAKINSNVLINKLYKCGFFSRTSSIQPIPKFGSTVTELISLGIITGYTNIVLCGIDMNDGAHFYDYNDYYKKYEYLRVLSKINNNKNVHEHMNKKIMKNTVKDIIVNLNDLAINKFDCKISVSSQSSALYPDLDKFNFN
jgi:hypothetical protein